MSVHISGTNDPMSLAFASDDEFLAQHINREEDKLCRTGDFEDRNEARRTLAGRVGVAPGTIENLRRRRHKGLRGRVREKILAFIIADLQRQIMRAQHNLEIAQRMAERPDEAAIFDAQAALTNAKQVLADLITTRNSPDQ